MKTLLNQSVSNCQMCYRFALMRKKSCWSKWSFLILARFGCREY